MKEKDKKECPKCGGDLRTLWTKGRKLMKKCNNSDPIDYDDDYCDWEGKPYTPPKKPIRASKTVHTDQDGWVYEGIDQYGHAYCYSMGYSSERACTKAAKEDVDYQNGKNSEMGKCVAIVWPPTTKVYGKIIR